MKILIMPSWYPSNDNPLNGTFFREQALLVQDDHDLKILYPRFIGRNNLPEFISRNKKQPSYYAALSPPEAETIFSPYISRVTEKIHLSHLIRASEKKIASLIKNGWKPDIIHAHSTVFAGICAVTIGRKYKIPVIITEHLGPFLLDNYSKYLKRKLRTALEKADLVATVSNHQSRMLLSHQIDIHPLIIGNLIDDVTFIIKPKKRLLEKFVILTVSGSQFHKDLDTFLKSLLTLRKKGIENFTATIISISELQGNHRKFIEENNLEEHIDFKMGIAREQMPDYYANCDVFVSSSIAETFGVAVGEAIASGRPAIITRNGGSEDFVFDGVNGYLVNIQDHKALAEKLVDVMNGKIKNLPKELRMTIVENYGHNAFRAKTNNLYNMVAKNRGER